jgi:TRAP-type C4-dicarboxylate transport system permease small subunit
MLTTLGRAAQSALRRLAGICLVALALLTLADVVGRYVLNYAIVGAVEMTEMLMVGVIFAGIVLATMAREHVAVDLVTLHMDGSVRRVQRIASNLLATGISLLLAAATWTQAKSALDFGDQTTMLGLPLAPVIFFMCAMLLVNALIHGWQTWEVIVGKDTIADKDTHD